MTAGGRRDTILAVMSRLTMCAIALCALLCACAPGVTLKQATFHEVGALRAEASDWRGAKTGVTYLRRAYEVHVGLATKPSLATSHLRVHLVRIAWDAEAPAVIPIAAPANARLTTVRARVFGADTATPVEPTARSVIPAAATPDPGQSLWSLSFPPVGAGEALEVIADFEISGTLATDARWIGAPDGATAQLLIRYDVPTAAKATMQVRGADASPVVTRQDGKQVFAVFLHSVPARTESAPDAHIRYVTRSASVRGYDQRYASSWSQISAPYTAALVQGSQALRMNHREPFRVSEAGAAGARAAALWVRDRIQRDDALKARWSEGRPLPNLVTTNNLQATDKVHLLRWLLDAAGIAHRVAAVRSHAFVPIDAALPFPEAFDGAAVYVPSEDLWLDPACRSCEPGQVRESFKGALGLLLPARSGATPVRLPE